MMTPMNVMAHLFAVVVLMLGGPSMGRHHQVICFMRRHGQAGGGCCRVTRRDQAMWQLRPCYERQPQLLAPPSSR